jgi:hypothetical protein
VFYATKDTLRFIEEIKVKHPIECEFLEFNDWDDFLIIARDIREDDNLIIVLSRKDKPSYQSQMTKIPSYLNKYFKSTSYILTYPMQAGKTASTKIDLTNPAITEPLEKLDEIGKTLAKMFRRK